MDQMKGSVQVMALEILQNIFRLYGAIKKIDLKEKSIIIIGPYEPAELLSCLIDQLKKVWEFSRPGRQTITIAMMVWKGITLLAKTATFNDDIREWRQKPTELNTWSNFKTFFQK